MDERFRSGDALFASDVDMRVVLWNAEAERLVGVSAADAVSHPCWEVVRGVDERGAVVCHRGCAAARLARDGWPVPTRRFLIPSEEGRRLVCAATVAVELDGPEPVVLHVLRPADDRPEADSTGSPSPLTRRQREVLELVALGVPAKVIAHRLGIAESTVRNHIQAILGALRCHSQLEAVAEARSRGII